MKTGTELLHGHMRTGDRLTRLQKLVNSGNISNEDAERILDKITKILDKEEQIVAAQNGKDDMNAEQ